MNRGEARRGNVEPEAGGEASALEALDAKEIAAMIERFAREHPHAAVASACALGFLLGGGLTPRLLALFASVVGRRYLAEALRETVERALEGKLGAREPA